MSNYDLILKDEKSNEVNFTFLISHFSFSEAHSYKHAVTPNVVRMAESMLIIS